MNRVAPQVLLPLVPEYTVLGQVHGIFIGTEQSINLVNYFAFYTGDIFDTVLVHHSLYTALGRQGQMAWRGLQDIAKTLKSIYRIASIITNCILTNNI